VKVRGDSEERGGDEASVTKSHVDVVSAFLRGEEATEFAMSTDGERLYGGSTLLATKENGRVIMTKGRADESLGLRRQRALVRRLVKVRTGEADE